jgi:N-acetylmuramoyl-L-alanine amidase
MNILLIAGHGNGDPGAVALGRREADLTRELVALIYTRLSKYASVDVFDTAKNMFKYLQSNSFNFKKYNYVLEVHFNAFNGAAHGTEILVHTSEAGVGVENAILKNIADLGFKNRGVKRRSDLLVMNTCKKQHTSHALLETCFIDNDTDISRYVVNRNKVADAIVKGIVDGFELRLIEPQMTIDEAISKLVNAGIIDTPAYWLNAVKSVEHLDTLIIKFAKTL